MAQTRARGSDAVVKLALHGDALVDVSGHLSGLSNTEFNEVRDSRAVPGGGGVEGYQLLPWKDGSGRLNIDINSVTAPILWTKNGKRFDAEISPEGTAAGMPKITFEFIMTQTIRYNARGVVTAENTYNVDGAITRATH